MKTVLVISSYVSASQVGGNVSAFYLAQAGICPVLLPTTILGRHPGWGDPGGGGVDTRKLQSIWDAINKQDFKFDAILTGYMANQEQVVLAEKIIDIIRTDNERVQVLVDPVMGDNGRLYVPETTAQAIIDKLVQKADIVTPNWFEFSQICGEAPNSAQDVAELTNLMPQDWLVTSLNEDERSGAVLVGPEHQVKIRHSRFPTVPNGCGDAFGALYLSHIVNGEVKVSAFQKSVSSIFAILKYANKHGNRELPIYTTQDLISNASPLQLSPL